MRSAVVLLLALVPVGPLTAAEPTFRVTTTEDADLQGNLESLGDGWSARVGGKQIAPGKLVEMTQADRRRPALPDTEMIVLAGGDCLPAREIRLAEERAQFRLAGAGNGPVKVAVESVAVFWFAPPAGTDDPDSALRQLLRTSRTQDQVLMRNGDTVEGLLAGIDAGTVRMMSDGKSLELRRDRVAAIALSSELAAANKPKGPYARLVLRDGTRVSFQSARSSDGLKLEGTTLFGAALSLPVADVVSLQVFQGPATYLSDLKPARFEFVPFLDVQWPLMTDAGVDGGGLVLSDGLHDKGLGMHSRCRVDYSLSGEFGRFEALVGLDARGGRAGHVVVRVLVDGVERGGSHELHGSRAPLPLRIPVAGAKTLSLLVDYGSGGPVGDHVDWADARLIRP